MEEKDIQLNETVSEKPVSVEVKEENTSNAAPRKQFNNDFRNNRNNNRDNRDNRGRGNRDDKKKLLESKIIYVGRVTKVTKGGRHFRFSATAVVGNRKGLVGIGTGKANEVPVAAEKAIQAANKNVTRIALIDNRTIPHEAIAKVGRAVVMIKPAKEGNGIIAGGAARSVLELAGVRDIVSKSLGSNTKINVAKATLEALKMQRTPAKIAALRGKTEEEL